MFGQAELNRLRERKQTLVAHSQAQRQSLGAELDRLRSWNYWQREVGQAAGRHPLLTAALAAGAGFVAIKALRRPETLVGWIGRLGGLGSAAASLWKLFRPKAGG